MWQLMPMASKDSRLKGKNRVINNYRGDIVSDFSKAFYNALQNVNRLDKIAQIKEKQFVAGEIENVHEVMIAIEKSKLALELTVEIRNKLLEAYKTIERMPV